MMQQQSARGLVIASILFACAGAGLAAYGWLVSSRPEPRAVQPSPLGTADALQSAFVAVADPTPRNVQLSVKHSILSLIWLDAAMIAAVAPIAYSLGVLTLLIPAYLLGRWVYST